mgnify:CR=1 FL=1
MIIINNKINILRKKIDSIDNQILTLLNERFKISKTILKEKQLNNIKIYDSNREKDIINKVKNLKSDYLTSESIENIYKEILLNSLKEMEKLS